MTIVPHQKGFGGAGGAECSMRVVGVDIHMSQHELDELYTTILLSDSPVAKAIADQLQPYAKKVSFR